MTAPWDGELQREIGLRERGKNYEEEIGGDYLCSCYLRLCRAGTQRATPLRCESAGRDYCARGEPDCRGGAGDSGFAGGDGGAVRVVPERDAGGLESDAAGDADCHAVCRHDATAPGEDAGLGAAAADVFCGRGRQRKISSERRGLHCVYERRWWRGVVPALSV